MHHIVSCGTAHNKTNFEQFKFLVEIQRNFRFAKTNKQHLLLVHIYTACVGIICACILYIHIHIYDIVFVHFQENYFLRNVSSAASSRRCSLPLHLTIMLFKWALIKSIWKLCVHMCGKLHMYVRTNSYYNLICMLAAQRHKRKDTSI